MKNFEYACTYIYGIKVHIKLKFIWQRMGTGIFLNPLLYNWIWYFCILIMVNFNHVHAWSLDRLQVTKMDTFKLCNSYQMPTIYRHNVIKIECGKCGVNSVNEVKEGIACQILFKKCKEYYFSGNILGKIPRKWEKLF